MKKHAFISVIAVALLLGIFASSPLHTQTTDNEIYAWRREKLMKEMDGGICVFQNSEGNKNFYYLTGFQESRAAIVLMPDEEDRFIMFVQPYNPANKSRTGELSGIEGVKKCYGADDAFPFDQFEKKLRLYLRGKKKIYCDFNNKELYEDLLRMTRRSPGVLMKTMIDPTNFIHEMRVIKSTEEIATMQKAIDITSDAHIEVMKTAEAGMYEYELQAVIEYIYRKNGSLKNGFSSIVGSGPNSVILHHEHNNRQTQSGDMVVMDIGAEYEEYTADITRTIPINGKFTKPQREIYQAVLDANKAALAMVAPGVGHQEVINTGIEKIKEALLRLGLITDKESRWQYRVWLTHGIGHWLGLVVHDVGDYNRQDKERPPPRTGHGVYHRTRHIHPGRHPRPSQGNEIYPG